MKFNQTITIGDRIINHSSPTYIIAEAGVNHGGNLEVAKELIDIAAEAKADAVKFQAFRTEELILKGVIKAPYQKSTTDALESQYEMLKRLEMTQEMNQSLQKYAQQKGVTFLSTPFDEVSLDELDNVDMPAYKIASTDLTNLPFLKKVALKGKPIFLSTGMSYLSEVQMALETIYEHNKDLILLQCTANYPIEDCEANLRIINTFKHHFDVLVGFSDHTMGIGAAPFAIPMGAKVIEKHFTLDKTLRGPDHRASLSPEELVELVGLIRRVDNYMGQEIKIPNLSEQATRRSLQKSIVAKRYIQKGTSIQEDDILAKRTGGIGISPIYFREIIGKTAQRDYYADDIIEY